MVDPLAECGHRNGKQERYRGCNAKTCAISNRHGTFIVSARDAGRRLWVIPRSRSADLSIKAPYFSYIDSAQELRTRERKEKEARENVEQIASKDGLRRYISRGSFPDGRNFINVLNGGTKQFGDTPGLRDAPARRMRRVAIGDFGQLSETRALQVFFERPEPRLRAFPGVRASSVNLCVSRNEWAHQPRPNGSLMIGRVPLSDVPVIAPVVIRVVRR